MKLKLKQVRKDRKLTIDQLADVTGISRGYISLLENGRRQPSSDALQTLATCLRVRVADLIDEGQTDSSKLPVDDVSTVLSIMADMTPDERKAAISDLMSRQRRNAS